MPPKRTEITSEQWARVQALFEELIESDDPDAVVEREPHPEIAEMARRLLHNHREAAAKGFLDDTITLVRELSSREGPRFHEGQRLAGRFLVERLLGMGGMGEVYLTHDLRLNERVAVKTVRAHLTADPAVRSRFIAEIQNARRVTHPNVCRIFDLFDEGEIPCFSMEYIEGTCLAHWLGSQAPERAAARRIALDLAEGLHAAHRNGIVHGDFKPGNVILAGDLGHLRCVITDFGLARALSDRPKPPGASTEPVVREADRHSIQGGTFDYMAPELLAGGHATFQSDIYAYGKVLGQLMPHNRLVERCLAERPQDRPDSGALIRLLSGGSTRRKWLFAAAAAATGVASYDLLLRRPRLVLTGRQRLAINGFQPAGLGLATTLRELLMTGLRQSPLLTVVADDHLRSVLEGLGLPSALPVSRAQFLEAAVRDGIPLVLEGVLHEVGKGLRIQLQVFEPRSVSPVLGIDEQVDDARRLVRLADSAALRLRRQLGESAGALRAGYTPLEQVTSASPEAVDSYLRGVQEYESARAREALVWFDDAIRLDPEFALAHLRRGMALAASFRVESAIPSYERAFELRGRVGERERLWIESRYYNIIGDFVSSRERCRRLTVLFPEEAVFQRHMAFACVRAGRPVDALPFNRRAVELDSTSDNNLSELIVNEAEANRCDEALELHRRFREQGHQSTLLNWGSGLAYMVKSEYDNARNEFEQMAQSPERERWSHLLRCGPLVLQGRFAEASSALIADLAYDIATDEQTRRQTRRSWLGSLAWLMDAPDRAYSQAVELVRLDASPAWLQPLREGGLLAVTMGETALADQAVERLTEIERRWPSTHTHGARAHLQGAALMGRDDEQAGNLLLEASGLRPDPLTLITLAEWQGRRNAHLARLATLELLELQRPSILRHYFPGLVVLCWIERARCLAKLSRFPESLRLYERVLNHWLPQAGTYKVVRLARSEHERLNLKSR